MENDTKIVYATILSCLKIKTPRKWERLFDMNVGNLMAIVVAAVVVVALLCIGFAFLAWLI
jgi:hypothetical protein